MDKLIRSTDTYPTWHFQPLRLLNAEMKNPMGVIKEFFDGYNLPEARKHLREMLEDAMCNVEVYAINYLTFYDEVEKLIEAAWLILGENEKGNAQPAVKTTGEEGLVASLQLLIAAIRPERIFWLSSGNQQVVDLLVVVPDRDAKPFRYYETVISTIGYALPNFSFSLHTVSSVRESLSAGSPFYRYACTGDKEVYTAEGATPLPVPPPGKEAEKERREFFRVSAERAASFFESAKACFESGSGSTALFMLHQAAELSLYALVRTLWGREIKEHSLWVLHKHIRRLHHPELGSLLSPTGEEERDRLRILDSAYLKSRYNVAFQPERENVVYFLSWVAKLLDACSEAANSLIEGIGES